MFQGREQHRWRQEQHRRVRRQHAASAICWLGPPGRPSLIAMPPWRSCPRELLQHWRRVQCRRPATFTANIRNRNKHLLAAVCTNVPSLPVKKRKGMVGAYLDQLGCPPLLMTPPKLSNRHAGTHSNCTKNQQRNQTPPSFPLLHSATTTSPPRCEKRS